jgi:tripartite-type tricarboxylate transporter receptor subunit TctC
VRAGKLRALALCSPARNAMVPDVPTTIEAGMPSLQVENWTAVMAATRTPDAIVERYSREILRIMAAPDMTERATQQGFRINAKGAEEFATFLRSEVELWSRVIKAAKITAG